MSWKKAFLVVLGLVILMWLPITRNIILLILPLGSGVDDLLFFILVGVLGLLLAIRAEKFGAWIRKTHTKESENDR